MNAIARALDRFNDWFNRQADRYRSGIAWALDHRLAVVGFAAFTLVLAVFLQARFGGFGFAPNSAWKATAATRAPVAIPTMDQR